MENCGDNYEVLKAFLLERKDFFEKIVGNLEANGFSSERYESLLDEYNEIDKEIKKLEGVEKKRKC